MLKSLPFSILFFCPFLVWCGESDDIFSLSLEELVTIEIATKNKQSIYSSPSSVYVITRQTIKQMGISNLQTLLNFVPGFQSTRDIEQGTANRISARGRSTALSESVLVQIDGNKVNDLYTGGISIINRLLDLGNVDHIEIIRGPGSALYGSNAFLGVVNIITTSMRNEVSISISHPAKISANLTYSHPFLDNQTTDVYLSLFKDKGHNYPLTDIYGITDNVRDPIKGMDVYLKQTLDAWLFTGRYMNRQLNDFIPLGSIGNDINQEQTQQWSVAAEYHGTLFKNLTYDAQLSHSQNKWETIALLIPKGVEINPGFSLTSNFIGGPFLSSQNTKFATNFRYQITNSHLLSTGISYEQAKINDVYTATTHDLFTLEPYEQSVRLTGEQSFNDKKSRNIASLYIQDQLSINELWELTAGLRYDNYNDFGSATSPRLAAVWKAKEKSSVKLMYGTAFRAPNFLELYDRNNYVDFGNINLNAEEVETVEVAWLKTADNWHFEITAFRNKFKQLILLGAPVEHPDNPFFSPSFTNIDGQQSKGFETELQVKLTQQLSMKILWNWFSDSSDIDVARNTGAVIFDYHYDNWHINFNSFYRGQNKAVKNQQSYIVTSANASLQVSSQLKLSMSLENMFNQQYRTQSIMYDQGIANRGRTASISFEYQF
ncbi:Colicin I receptor [Pseudoalteromonas holothuriae]|uniref:Colicin I receptor n=1 Tax=Pseudoalteromonas holothuriae TaxID=2963714 RepID=A0ABM9GIS6_9GAMM|nr:TonB-dependent receptor [Pseudoalteromonas sp. CIP111951]CAH9059816.1 Colicin I receptor [Pseudoalteromonas sp. CIP111951]